MANISVNIDGLTTGNPQAVVDLMNVVNDPNNFDNVTPVNVDAVEDNFDFEQAVNDTFDEIEQQNESVENKAEKQLNEDIEDEELNPVDVDSMDVDEFYDGYVTDNAALWDEDIDYDAMPVNKDKIFQYWKQLVKSGENEWNAVEIAVRKFAGIEDEIAEALAKREVLDPRKNRVDPEDEADGEEELLLEDEPKENNLEADLEKMEKEAQTAMSEVDKMFGESFKSKGKMLKEEYGPYHDDDIASMILQEVGDKLESGNDYGWVNNRNGDTIAEWKCTINGTYVGDMIQNDNVLDWILYEVSYPVKDGFDHYRELHLLLSNYSGEFDFTDETVVDDFAKLGFDADEVRSLANNPEKEIECWADFDLAGLDMSEITDELYYGEETDESYYLDEACKGKKKKALEEDTVKQGSSWVNKGKEGTHGKFKTKKAADKQRKAMFANGYKAESAIKEGNLLTEGTSNFMMFDSPNLAYTDEECEMLDIPAVLGKDTLPYWYYEKAGRSYPTTAIPTEVDSEYAFVGRRPGYYEGVNIGVVANNEFEEWAYNNYDEENGTYYEFGSEAPISGKELREKFEAKVKEEVAKGIEYLKQLKKEYGGRFINVSAQFSNGETWYSEEQLDESEDVSDDYEKIISGSSEVARKANEMDKRPQDEYTDEFAVYTLTPDRKDIVDMKYIKKSDVYDYKPNENEYGMVMTRDTGWFEIDNQLEPMSMIINKWNQWRKPMNEAYRARQQKEMLKEAKAVNDSFDEEPVKVFFVKERNPYTEKDEVLAVFPDIIATNDGLVSCYAHMGQHSTCDLDYVKTLEPATEEEYASLLRELKTAAKYDNLVVVSPNEDVLKEAVDDEDDTDTYEYVWSSLVNGNLSQYHNLLKKMSKYEIREYIDWAEEQGIPYEDLQLDYMYETLNPDLQYHSREGHMVKDGTTKPCHPQRTVKTINSNGKEYAGYSPKQDEIMRDKVVTIVENFKKVIEHSDEKLYPALQRRLTDKLLSEGVTTKVITKLIDKLF